MTQPHDDDFTELVDANLPRVDLVGKGANGLPFLVAKAQGAQGGILPAQTVRDLIAKANPRDDEKELFVSLTGSPAAIAAMIHNAPTRKVEKETAVSEPIAKDDGALDAAVEVSDIIAEAPGGSTAESVPGSPDWEELDAGTAESAIGVLGRAKAAIEWLVTREDTEAVTSGDADDACNAWDLSDAAASIDYAIRTLGAFAAGEKLEAGLAAEMGDVAKAAAGVEEPVAVLERLAPVAKAGRVLSAANEARIKTASDSLAEVLSSLPAPIEDGLAVAKSEEDTVTDTPADAAAEVAKVADETISPELQAAIEQVEKAKGDPLVICYNSQGKAIGLIDPEKLQPIADENASDDTTPAAEPAADASAPADPGTPAAAPAAPAADTTPAPADQAGTPTAATDDDVAKTQTPDTTDDTVRKAVTDAIEAALQDHPVVKALKDRIAELEAPAPSRVLRNGVIPADLTVVKRSQDETPGDVDVAKAGELREQLAAADTPAEREQVAKQMQATAAQALAALHGTRPHPAR